jgi:hypothetical protein
MDSLSFSKPNNETFMRGANLMKSPFSCKNLPGKFKLLAIVSATSLLFSNPAQADDANWSGNDPSTDWMTGANWSGGTGAGGAPASGQGLVFGSAGTNGTTLSNSLTSSGFSVAGITFNSGGDAFTFNGNTFTLTDAITNNGTQLQTFNNTDSTTGLYLNAANTTWTIGGGITITNGLTNSSNDVETITANGTDSGTLTLGGLALNSGAASVTDVINGSGVVSITGEVSNGGAGTNGLTYSGTGTLILSGSNSYTGSTNVNSGTVQLSNTSGSATGSSTLTVNAGGTLAGAGASSGSGLNITGTGTTTNARAKVLVGVNAATAAQAAATTANTANLTLVSSSLATIGDANLTFNINSSVAGGLGTDTALSGNELVVGATQINFLAGVNSTVLNLNMLGTSSVTVPSAYVLIAGTDLTQLGASTSQYTGLTFGTSIGTLETGLITPIALSGVNQGGNLVVNAGANYPSSYLFLYQNSAGVDDIEVEVAPEPGTWAMLLGGLALLAFWRRASRKSKLA